MKYVKYLAKIALLGLLVCICLAVASCVVTPKDNTEEAGMNHAAEANAVACEEPNTLDVICFGDSVAVNAIAPCDMYDAYGFTSYQCAAPGEYMPFAVHMMQKALDKQSPKVVVVETSVVFGPFSVQEAVNRELKEAFPVFQYHERWKKLRIEDFMSFPKFSTKDPNKGFLPRTDFEPVEGSNDFESTDEVVLPPKLSRIYMEYLTRYCEERGSQVVLVSAPNVYNWDMAQHNGAAQLAEQLGIPYVDMAFENVGIDWQTDSRDAGYHLNGKGAKKTSLFLGKWLLDRYDLPDHRGDAAYAEWDADSADFVSAMRHHKQFEPRAAD